MSRVKKENAARNEAGERKVAREEETRHVVLDKSSPSAPEPSTLPQEPETLSHLIAQLESELDLAQDSSRDPRWSEFQQALLQKAQDKARLLLDLAVAWYEMERFDFALEMIAAIKEQDVFYWESQCLKGQMMREEKNYVASLEVYKSCYRSPQAPFEARFEAGYQVMELVYFLGEHEKAFEIFKKLEKSRDNYRQMRFWKRELTNKVES